MISKHHKYIDYKKHILHALQRQHLTKYNVHNTGQKLVLVDFAFPQRCFIGKLGKTIKVFLKSIFSKMTTQSNLALNKKMSVRNHLNSIDGPQYINRTLFSSLNIPYPSQKLKSPLHEEKKYRPINMLQVVQYTLPCKLCHFVFCTHSTDYYPCYFIK